MVCIPCIVIPVLLFVFHKFIRPILQKYFPQYFGSLAVEAKDINFTNEILTTPEGKHIKMMIDKNPVMMFSKTTCTYCSMAKKALSETNVVYEVEELDKNSQDKNNQDKMQDIFKALTGERTVPRVFIGGKCIGGGTETMSLSGQGLLVPMMKEAGATFNESKKDS